MVARDVVPSDAVVVDVVQDGHAGLVGAVDVILGVVRLSGLLVARLRPRVEGPAVRCLVGRCHLLAIRRPEPAVKGLGLEVTSVFAALEVAETSGRPDIWNVVCEREDRSRMRRTCRLLTVVVLRRNWTCIELYVIIHIRVLILYELA